MNGNHHRVIDIRLDAIAERTAPIEFESSNEYFENYK